MKDILFTTIVGFSILIIGWGVFVGFLVDKSRREFKQFSEESDRKYEEFKKSARERFEAFKKGGE